MGIDALHKGETEDNNNNNKKKKKLKYKSICIQIKRMWNLKCTIIPVITGATGIVTRSLRKHLEINKINQYF
jgi:hypothetical protein